VAGASEGGTYALGLAQSPELPLAGVILLVTPGQSQLDLIATQIRTSFTLDPRFTSDQADQHVAELRAILERFVAGESIDLSQETYLAELEPVLRQYLNPASVDLSRWVLGFDPAAAFATISQPVLILHGGRDIQVPADPHGVLLEAGATEAGRDVTRVVIEHADHVLKHQAVPFEELGQQHALEYNAEGRTLDEEVVGPILNWLNQYR